MPEPQILLGLIGTAGSGKDTVGQFLVKEHDFYSLALADPIKIYCQWMFAWHPANLWGTSERRNRKDVSFPFLRCPSCGFTAYHQSLHLVGAGVECDVCSRKHAPKDWQDHLSPRYALQSLGDWARNLFENSYVDFALRRVALVKRHGVSRDPLWPVLAQLKVSQDRWVSLARDKPVARILISDVRLKNEVNQIQKADGQIFRVQRTDAPQTTTSGIPQHNSEMEQQEIPDHALDGVIMNTSSVADLRVLVARWIIQKLRSMPPQHTHTSAEPDTAPDTAPDPDPDPDTDKINPAHPNTDSSNDLSN